MTPPPTKKPGDRAYETVRVECPNCNAQPMEPCTQPTNTGRRNVAWFHFAREKAIADRIAPR